MQKILLGSLALILSAGVAACDDNANGEAHEGAKGNSALPQEALPAADVLKPVDPSIPEIDLSQPATIIAGPGADTGQAGIDETGNAGEEGGPDRAGGPEGAAGEGIAPSDAGEGPSVDGDKAPAEEDGGAGEIE